MLSAKVDEPMKRLLDECIETVYIIKGTTDTVTHVLERLARVGMASPSRSGGAATAVGVLRVKNQKCSNWNTLQTRKLCALL